MIYPRKFEKWRSKALFIASGPPSGMPGGSKSEPETLNEAGGMFVSGRRKVSDGNGKNLRDADYAGQ